jgi:hypothetical protein
VPAWPQALSANKLKKAKLARFKAIVAQIREMKEEWLAELS